jgi:hypothetical protein
MSVFSLPHRILVARSGFDQPLVAFSPQGKLDRDFASHLHGLVPQRPHHEGPVGPVAALDRGNLVFAWSDHSSARPKAVEVNLQQVLLR